MDTRSVLADTIQGVVGRAYPLVLTDYQIPTEYGMHNLVC